MRSLNKLKEVQQLVGRLTSLCRFMPMLADKIKLIMKLIKKAKKFPWNETCKEAFKVVKQTLSQPPILRKPIQGLPLLVYLVTSPIVMSVAIVQGTVVQKPIYFEVEYYKTSRPGI